jgi:hypothetical protein
MSDTGHAKNIMNFEVLVNIVIALGDLYKPANPLTLISALQSMLAEAKQAITDVGAKDAAETNAGKLRETTFEGHAKLATRIGNAYASGDNDELVSSNLAGYVRKLRGERAGEKPAPVTNEAGEKIDPSHSVSQQSYDSIVSNWRLLIQLLETQSGYRPNEEDLKIASIRAFADNLEATNNAAKLATIDVKNARAERDRILYDERTGMLYVVKKVKKYVSTLKNAGAALDQLVDLKFKEVK